MCCFLLLRESRTPVLKVDFSKWDASSDLNGFFKNMTVREKPEGKDFKALDILSQFWLPFLIVPLDS